MNPVRPFTEWGGKKGNKNYKIRGFHQGEMRPVEGLTG